MECLYARQLAAEKDDEAMARPREFDIDEALEKAKVPNQLFTIRGGGHGGFTQAEYVRSYEAVWTFLRQHKIIQ